MRQSDDSGEWITEDKNEFFDEVNRRFLK